MASERDEGAQDRSRLPRILAGFAVLWLVLDRSAAALGSFTGEAGIIVCLVVLLAAVIVERILFARGPLSALRTLGFRWPERRTLVASLLLAMLLLGFYPIFSLAAAAPIGLAENWPLLLPGLFAQGGVAEEVVFRGYLFRHMRRGRGFWHAALLSSLPFIAVHLLLFLSLDFSIALAALIVSISLSFPLAWLFDRSGASVWPPALIHFVVQGSIKLITVPDGSATMLALAWMAYATLLPWSAFLLRPRPPESAP